MFVYLKEICWVFVLTNIIYGAISEQFSGVFKHEHKFLASQIRALFQTRAPTDFVQREVLNWNGSFEIG